MLFASSQYLAPNTTINISREFLDVLEDVSKIKEFNWCTFVAKYLISRIKSFKSTISLYFVDRYAHTHTNTMMLLI
jgi:hypothetical protein